MCASSQRSGNFFNILIKYNLFDNFRLDKELFCVLITGYLLVLITVKKIGPYAGWEGFLGLFLEKIQWGVGIGKFDPNLEKI